MAQVPGEVDNMEGLLTSNNNNPAARWESPDRGWEREQPAASTAAASLFECSRIKALAGTWERAGWETAGREGRGLPRCSVCTSLPENPDGPEDGKTVTDTETLNI